jgi:hypothetical protein
MKPFNPGQLDSILELCHTERLHFNIYYQGYQDRISSAIKATDYLRAVESGVRSVNRFGKEPDKVLGRIQEELFKRHMAVPAPAWDSLELAKTLDEILALKPGGFEFAANFYQRGTRPYFQAKSAAIKETFQGNCAEAVCKAYLAALKALQAAAAKKL